MNSEYEVREIYKSVLCAETPIKELRWFLFGSTFRNMLYLFIITFYFSLSKGEQSFVIVDGVYKRRKCIVFKWVMSCEQKISTSFEVTKSLIAAWSSGSSPSGLGSLTLAVSPRTWQITIAHHTLSHECHDTKPLFLCKAIQNELLFFFCVERHKECFSQVTFRHLLV